jgi:hypothetical protein
MKARTVSFEALQLEAETSRIPSDAKITVRDFCETIERLYGK